MPVKTAYKYAPPTPYGNKTILECQHCMRGYNVAMDAMIVKIGNSQGVHIPKPLIEEAGLGDQVSLRVVEEGLLIEPTTKPRTGWAEAAQQGQGTQEGSSDDVWGVTHFDSLEWEWDSTESNL